MNFKYRVYVIAEFCGDELYRNLIGEFDNPINAFQALDTIENKDDEFDYAVEVVRI